MQPTILLMVVMLYQGDEPNVAEAHRYEENMPTMAACWERAHAIADADISQAEELIGIGAGCTIIGSFTRIKG